MKQIAVGVTSNMSHVYVAEDDPDVRSSIAEILREEGYEVREFSNAQQTLRAISEGNRPCIVLMDLLMPEMSGLEFLAALRLDAELLAIPVVMITGARTEVSGAQVLRKPFELTDLIAAVSRHCAHRRRVEGSSGSERYLSPPARRRP